VRIRQVSRRGLLRRNDTRVVGQARYELHRHNL
jgi:hypothetical protein